MTPRSRISGSSSASLAKSDLAKTDDLGPAIGAFLDNKTLSAEQQNEIHRLLGLYARVKYGSAATETLRELVAIPTFRVDGVAQHDNPEFLKIADKIKGLAQAFNLNFRNVDNRVYEISLEGSGDEVVGIHAHADVVPVTPENWVLQDGTRLDPFKVTLIGDRMYGRGTEDDKNGIVVALYAMKVIKEEKLPLARNFKLLVDTTEETTGDAIPYYFERNPTPNYNLALDGGYPVVIAEKGYGTVMANFAKRKAEGKGAEIISMTGGLATNQIPSTSVATLVTDKPAELAASLQKAGSEYAKRNGGNFEVTRQGRRQGRQADGHRRVRALLRARVRGQPGGADARLHQQPRRQGRAQAQPHHRCRALRRRQLGAGLPGRQIGCRFRR